MRQFQLPASDAQTFVWDRPLGDYFESIAPKAKNPKAAANWIINNLRAKLTEINEREKIEQSEVGLEPADLQDVYKRQVSLTCAKPLFSTIAPGASPLVNISPKTCCAMELLILRLSTSSTMSRI